MAISISYSDVDQARLDKESLTRLTIATEWLIVNGLSVAYRSSERAFSDMLISDFGVNLWIRPNLSPERYRRGFYIKSREFNSHMFVIKDVTVDNLLYEYWVSQIVSSESAPRIRQSEFYITCSKDAYGIRNIIKQSSVFIENFRIDDDNSLYVSDKDLETLYMLDPTDFPSNYLGSSIEGKKVYIDKNKNFKSAQ